MDNYGHPYGDPYGYAPPPPPNYPPQQGLDPYPLPQNPQLGQPHPYPYNPSNSFSYPYHQPPPPPPHQSHSGPLDYQNQYPPPAQYPPPPGSSPPHAHQSHSGPLDYQNQYPPPPGSSPPHAHQSHSGPLDYQNPYPPPAQYPSAPPGAPPLSSSHAPYPYPYAYPNPNPNPNPPYAPPLSQASPQPSLHYQGSFSASFHQPPESYPRVNSFSGYDRQDSVVAEASAPGYPPIESHFNRLQVSDNQPSTPPSAPVLTGATSFQGHQSISARYSQRTEMYGYPNNSFSSSTESYKPESAVASPPSFNGSSQQGLQIVPVPSKGSLKFMLLHGNLDIWVHEAKNLPNMDMFHKTLTDVFGKKAQSVTTKIDGHVSRVTSDPYVTISVANAVVGRTYVISNSENPVWKQHFNVPVAHHASEAHFVVKDSDVVGSQIIGLVAIPAEHLIGGNRIEGSFPILSMSSRKQCKPGAELKLSIQYIPIERLTAYDLGVGAGPNYTGVPGTYFPLRTGGKVTLYQDAHVPDGSLPALKLDNGLIYEHGKCWHDICNAISQARRLIYITGWSVYHKVRLVRDVASGSNTTLGDLLKAKSQEGVRVLLLIWDDPTSRSILGYQTDGLMGTHDEETRRFFKHSSVHVLLTARSAGKRHSWAKQQETGTIYTHHQKSVIVDADAGRNLRKLVAFVGGLDLCDGRYDNPEHSLFRTLQSLHKDDFHNPSFAGSNTGCPREPWHDLHSRLDGPVAYDVLTNFEERWNKASKRHGINKLKKSSDDALLIIDRIPDIIGMFDAERNNENDPENWHVQIFRSIDSNSVKGFPKDPKDATSKNLVCGKNVLIDMSIHTAYVHAIRSAQHFIYIENQYFLGSSYNWTHHKDLGANNLIPMEIALKIANKIRAKERFAAYIVVPMWPEGVPTGTATQRILFWQHKTMQMMYETIYKALEEAGLEHEFVPEDYLNFFCLGNREALDANTGSIGGSPNAAQNTPQALCQKSRRFMIYVHSKGMIVDDEYVILGSANINQRSMEGTRDTEIAMGAYQPQHTWARRYSHPRAQIYGYRMSLWAEHTGTLEECFEEPESIDCVRRIRSMGGANWRQFAADDATEMRGHLMKYPVEVDKRGKVRPLPGSESFPDVGGNITGTFFAIQENLTI